MTIVSVGDIAKIAKKYDSPNISIFVLSYSNVHSSVGDFAKIAKIAKKMKIAKKRRISFSNLNSLHRSVRIGDVAKIAKIAKNKRRLKTWPF